MNFDLPKPSYTSTTLSYIKEKYPDHEFSLIMGEDNLRTLHKWKNHEDIINNHNLYVYPRALTEQERTEQVEINTENEFKNHEHVIYCDAPVMKVSSSYIRNAIKDKKDVRYLLTEPVFKYVTEMHFYEK